MWFWLTPVLRCADVTIEDLEHTWECARAPLLHDVDIFRL
jgi:hypothetical protein